MHEWALSDSVARAAAAVKKEKGLKTVSAVTVVLGEVQDIAPEVFKENFDELKKSHKGLEKTELKIETERAAFDCNNCGAHFNFDRSKLPHETAEDIHFMPETLRFYITCPKCKSQDFKISAGRGVYIKEIEGEK
ncbi:MAG: hydrogenase nickel incorporation protein HypA [Elusimicrobia bacterium]|nr:hydrogenase nickel incorporation protein HypA [Elusimicrobiota bacterium]